MAVPIPFGYTMLVEPHAIHGDSCMRGMHMMSMTGDHHAMGTADTVYLKNAINKRNINVTCYAVDHKLDDEVSLGRRDSPKQIMEAWELSKQYDGALVVVPKLLTSSEMSL